VNFDLAIEQKLLKDSAREFFAKEIDKDYVREMVKDEGIVEFDLMTENSRCKGGREHFAVLPSEATRFLDL
jgi:hypothetical protein